MKKLRLTKITVRTREVVVAANTAAGENQGSTCPLCHAPLSASFPAKQSSAGAISDQQQPPAELPAAHALIKRINR